VVIVVLLFNVIFGQSGIKSIQHFFRDHYGRIYLVSGYHYICNDIQKDLGKYEGHSD